MRVTRLSEIIEAKRQTGRTTRLVEAAVALALRGKRVLILVHPYGVDDMLNRLQAIGADRYAIVVTAEVNGFNWSPLEHPRYPGYFVLVDHYLIEETFEKMLGMWVIFDANDEPLIEEEEPR